MKLVLHIGSPKTGTKAAQHWLRENRGLLARQGIWHPSSLGVSQSSRLPLMFLPFEPGSPQFVIEGVESEEDYKLFISLTRSNFHQEWRQAQKDQMRFAVISSELLQLCINDVDQLTQLIGYLSPYFAEIEILLTIRPQTDAVVSWSSTAARGGEVIDEPWFRNMDRHKYLFSYRRHCHFWSGVCGREHFHIHAHDQNRPFSSILAQLVDLDASAGTNETRRNSALGLEALTMLNALRLSNTLTAPVIAKLTSKTEDDFLFRSPLSIGPTLARWIQAHFDEENEELLACFQHLKRSDLVPDWAKYEWAPNLGRLNVPCDFSPELEALMASMAMLVQEAEQQTKELRREFQRSTSWRITAPLRTLKRRFAKPDLINVAKDT